MKKRWVVLAVLMGSAAFGLVFLWPPQPLWQATLGGEASALSFTADGRELLVESRELPDPWGVLPVLYHRLDSETGHPITAPVAITNFIGETADVTPSPDGNRLLISGNIDKKSQYRLHDPERGVSVPLPEAIGDWQLGPECFSPDSRWLWTLRPGERRARHNGGDVRDGRTGESVRRIELSQPGESLSCRFAPDGSALAVLRSNRRSAPCTVEIWDLPAGSLQRRFDLPADQTWWRLDGWWANRLSVIATDGNGGQRTFSFDLNAADIGPGRDEPLRSGVAVARSGHLWSSGSGWVAHYDSRHPAMNWQHQAQAWFATKFNQPWLQPRTGTTQLTFFDGNRPRAFRLPPLPYEPIIRRDGRRVACARDGCIEVWDADPGPHWPWALLVGVGVMVPMLMFGRWRAKR